MEKTGFSLPLFPLSAHILPQGRMSLRIFEPRYVSMVKEACAQQTGFGICMLNAKGDKQANQHIFPIGTYVEVVDFDWLDDGFLGIEVQASRCFEIHGISTQDDGLRIGECHWLAPWPEITSNQGAFMHLQSQLQQVFEHYSDLRQRYPQPQFDNPNWVIYRWLEIVPLEADFKQELISKKDCGEALKILSNFVDPR